MAKFRICPNCGAKNPPNLLSCKECGSDSLEFEKILDDTVENKQSNDEVVATQDALGVGNAVRMVRICDCGTHNAVNVRKCTNCGEDISFITPVNELELPAQNSGHSEISQENKFILSSLDGSFAYEIKENITVIGRECSMSEYLSSKKYVSRKHAELLKENGKIYVKNLSKTNFTYINNEKIEEQKYVEIKDGDELGVGGKVVNNERQQEAAYFMMRIGSCM